MRVAYQAADVGQIWLKKEKCPSLEDVSHSGLRPNWPENDAHDWSSEELVTQQTLAKCGKKMMPLVGGLCLTADFDQM